MYHHCSIDPSFPHQKRSKPNQCFSLRKVGLFPHAISIFNQQRLISLFRSFYYDRPLFFPTFISEAYLKKSSHASQRDPRVKREIIALNHGLLENQLSDKINFYI